MKKRYSVKEVYFTLQGEGLHAGRPAVFCRFTGCNLWSGRVENRSQAACWFCDTNFVGVDGVGGGTFNCAELASHISQSWPGISSSLREVSPVYFEPLPYVVFTGGEPLLQLDTSLIAAVRAQGFTIAVETNGTIPAPKGIDWLTVSPKPNSTLIQKSGNELKLVYPHEVVPESVQGLPFDYFYLSPMTTSDAAQTRANLNDAVQYCKMHPQWRLTMQYHKLWGIP